MLETSNLATLISMVPKFTPSIWGPRWSLINIFYELSWLELPLPIIRCLFHSVEIPWFAGHLFHFQPNMVACTYISNRCHQYIHINYIVQHRKSGLGTMRVATFFVSSLSSEGHINKLVIMHFCSHAVLLNCLLFSAQDQTIVPAHTAVVAARSAWLRARIKQARCQVSPRMLQCTELLLQDQKHHTGTKELASGSRISSIQFQVGIKLPHAPLKQAWFKGSICCSDVEGPRG